MYSSMSSKRKKASPVQSTSTPSLPDDLLLSCFARISRFYYPTLSLVSKRFRSLIVSPELYKTRSLLGQTESLLYVCLRFYTEPKTRWFILYPKQDLRKKKKKKSSGYVLELVSIPNSPPLALFSTLVAVGSSIYMLGGSKYKDPLSKFSILDCVSHTWRAGPSMGVERYCSKANVIDGKIYVAGGSDNNSTKWMDVFDTKTETWEPVLNPLIEKCESHVSKSVVIDDEIYMYEYDSNWGVAYKPKEDRWKALEDVRLGLRLEETSSCVIDNIVYCYYARTQSLQWYNSKRRSWLPLKGLKTSTRFACHVHLVNHGGKLVIFLVNDVYSSGDKFNKIISCEVIALERRTSVEIWGNVEWRDVLLTVPSSYSYVCALTVTV